MQVYAGFEWYNGTHYLKKLFRLEQDAETWVASQAGGWQLTWLATGACSLLGVVLAAAVARRLRGLAQAHSGHV